MTNEQQSPSEPQKPVANFQAYGNAGVMYEDGSSSLESAPKAEGQSREEPKAAGPAQEFMSALQAMEKDRQIDHLAVQFSEDCKLWRQSSGQPYEGAKGVQDFWQQYLHQFASIDTHFTNVVEREQLAILEWESHGSLQGGRPLRYTGVSILELGAEGKVKVFKTYFDSAPFISPEALAVKH